MCAGEVSALATRFTAPWFIPARAGELLVPSLGTLVVTVHPRECGAEPFAGAIVSWQPGFIPCLRGAWFLSVLSAVHFPVR